MNKRLAGKEVDSITHTQLERIIVAEAIDRGIEITRFKSYINQGKMVKKIQNTNLAPTIKSACDMIISLFKNEALPIACA